ncbi:hypothetical protein HK099_005818 [Clydaea vesicula]|uniref:Centrosomal protein of 70 kDa n=1 Tax=Clydaea vesicula TaxID=447962 RepID=A0AAD5XUQ0_9FUNG|nr:hypothetical protein HK099_005818 [Clydaea vesicula]
MDTHSNLSTPRSNTSSTNRSEKDVTAFVKYLLDGSGAEENVDFIALRKELDINQLGSSTNILDGLSYASSTSPKRLSEEEVNIFLEQFSEVRNNGNLSKDIVESTDNKIKENQLFQNRSNSKSSPQNVNLKETVADSQILDKGQREYSKTAENEAKAIEEYLENDNRTSFTKQREEEAEEILHNLSESLKWNGFDPLPSKVFSKASLTQVQIENLNQNLTKILNELEKKSALIHLISEKNNDLELELRKEKLLVKELNLKNTDSLNLDTKINLDLKKELESNFFALNELKLENVNLKNVIKTEKIKFVEKNRELEEKCETIKKLESDLSDILDKKEKERLRIERTFHDVTQKYHRNPSKSGLDRLTLEVISYYEEKLKNLELQLQQDDDHISYKSREYTDNSNINTSNFHKRESLQDDEIKDFIQHQLEKDLLETKKLLKKTENELELIKLENLNKLNNASDALDREFMSTRDLIQNDKRAYKLSTYSLESYSKHELQDMISNVCVKLGIENIKQLSSDLNDLERVIKLISQMQTFIDIVDDLVWQEQRSSKVPPHKLNDTLKLLKNLLPNREKFMELQDFLLSLMEIVGQKDKENINQLFNTIDKYAKAYTEQEKSIHEQLSNLEFILKKAEPEALKLDTEMNAEKLIFYTIQYIENKIMEEKQLRKSLRSSSKSEEKNLTVEGEEKDLKALGKVKNMMSDGEDEKKVAGHMEGKEEFNLFDSFTSE